MKRTYILLFSLFILGSASAQVVINIKPKPQGPAEFISNVPSFSFSEPFKLVVDVSGVPNLNNVEPIYIWGFIQGCCGAPTNGDFCNSNEASVLTKEGPNLWSIVIPSVKSYMGVGYKQARDAAIAAGRTGDQTRFGFLFKADNGCGGFQTNDLEIPFTGPVYVKEVFETFPLNSAETDVVTLKYNQDLETNATMKSQAEVYLYATATLTDGTTLEPFTPQVVGNTASLKLTKTGNQHAISIIPRRFFTVPAGKQIERINVLIRSKTDPNINFGNSRQVRIVRIK